MRFLRVLPKNEFWQNEKDYGNMSCAYVFYTFQTTYESQNNICVAYDFPIIKGGFLKFESTRFVNHILKHDLTVNKHYMSN